MRAKRFAIKYPRVDEEEVMEDLLESVDELLEYYDLESEEWPMDCVHDQGIFRQGIITDELYQLLLNLKEVREELMGEEG